MQKGFISRFWKHKILVTYSLSQTGRVKGTNIRTSFISLAVLATISGSLGYYYLTAQPIPAYAAINNIDISSVAYEDEIKRLNEENFTNDKQIKIFARELGVLQARLDRFDAIGEKLFNDSSMSEHLSGIESLEGKGSATAETIAETPSVSSLNDLITQLHGRANSTEVTMQASLNMLSMNSMNQSQKPHIWPVIHERTRLTSAYGYRQSPFKTDRGSSHKGNYHGGMDIAGGYNAKIVSSADGVVVFSGYRYNYGILVEIRHANGISTRYAHLNKSVVKNGQKVSAGEDIALMGSTGRSTGPHLHFEILIGDKKVNPFPFVKDTKSVARQQGRELKASNNKLASLVK